MNRSFWLIFLRRLACFLAVHSFCTAQAAHIALIDVGDTAPRRMLLPSNLEYRKSALLVTAAPITKSLVVLADYADIYCFDPRLASIRLIPRPQGLAGPWNPTGLFYHHRIRRLFVANYHGNNIVEASLDCKKRGLRIESVISSPNTISPENVALTADGRILVAANYDGSTITAFARRLKHWKPLWTQKVPLAHGVAIIANHAYATSLQERKILKLDLMSGLIVQSSGQLGVNVAKTEMMWPTSLANFHDRLLMSDPHTGFVCYISLITLNAEMCFGGNGRGAARFNMPYAVAPYGNHLLVLSAFSSRVAEVAPPDFRAKRVPLVGDWYWTGNRPLNFKYFENPALAELRSVATPENPYTSICPMASWLQGFTCGYGGLASTTGLSKFLRLPTENSVGDVYSYFYFINSFMGRSAKDIYLFSPQASRVFNLRLLGDVPYAFQRSYGFGFELMEDQLVSSTESIDLNKIRDEFDRYINRLTSKRNRDGVIPLSEAADVLNVDEPGQNATRKLEAHLAKSIGMKKSSAGQEFLRKYFSCTDNRCDADGLRRAAIRFAMEQVRETDIGIDRLVVPCMLVNAPCGAAILEGLSTK